MEIPFLLLYALLLLTTPLLHAGLNDLLPGLLHWEARLTASTFVLH